METARRIIAPSKGALSFSYDEVGDILYIDATAPYAEQESDELTGSVIVRRNPKTRAVENVEVLFFTERLLGQSDVQISRLTQLFSVPQSQALPANRPPL